MSGSSSPGKPTGGGGGSLKSRIAAFESGAASNASWANTNTKDIQAANMSQLRSKFHKDDDKPLVVKGSFGLGAPPPSDDSPNKGGLRAVSLGGGRAISPIGTPSVFISPSKSQPKSESLRALSAASTTPSSTATGSSSLLPGPVQALASSTAIAPEESSGLKTPMSSMSLSSMAVETGSASGDTSSVKGLDAEEKSQPGTPLEDVSPAKLAENADDVPSSAAELEKAEKEGIIEPETDSKDVEISAADLKKAKDELEQYEKEEPSVRGDEQLLPPQEEVPAPPSVPRLSVPQPMDDDAAADSPQDAGSPSPSASPSKRTPSIKSRPTSLISPRMRRSSTANSIAESHPESDLGDTKLDDLGKEHLGLTASAPETPAGPREPRADTDDETAADIGQSLAPKEGASSDAPIPSLSIVADSVNRVQPNEDASDLSETMPEPASDEEPKVRCSDCGRMVPLMELGEHVCKGEDQQEVLKTSVLGHNRGGSGDSMPDVPTSDFEPSPHASPQAGVINLPGKPDVPDDMDEAYDDHSVPMPNTLSDNEEEYMTALTSRRDSADSITRPIIETPSASLRNMRSIAETAEDVDTPKLKDSSNNQVQPESPTPATPSTAKPKAAKNKYLGDTDSETEGEPGTVTIVKH